MPEEAGHGVEGKVDCVNEVWEGQVRILNHVLTGLCSKELTIDGRRFVYGLIENIRRSQNRRVKHLTKKPGDCGCKKRRTETITVQDKGA